MLYVNPVEPVAVTVMLPLFAGVTHGVVFTIAAVITIVVFPHTLVAVSVTCFVPRQPFEFLAVRVYVPAARLLNVPLVWYVPLFKL